MYTTYIYIYIYIYIFIYLLARVRAVVADLVPAVRQASPIRGQIVRVFLGRRRNSGMQTTLPLDRNSIPSILSVCIVIITRFITLGGSSGPAPCIDGPAVNDERQLTQWL